MDEVIQNIIAIRKLKGLSQKDLAQKIGIAQSNYARIEQKKSDITLKRLHKIAGIFNMTFKDLINWQPSEKAYNDSIAKRKDKVRKEINDIEKQIDKLNAQIPRLKEDLKLLKKVKGQKQQYLDEIGTAREYQL